LNLNDLEIQKRFIEIKNIALGIAYDLKIGFSLELNVISNDAKKDVKLKIKLDI
jgi:hypothetical protein